MPRYKPSKGSKRFRLIQLRSKEAIVVSQDVRRENADFCTESLFLADRICHATEIQVPETLVNEEPVHLSEHFDSLIKRSLLYEIAKPVVESIVSSISKAITATGTLGRKTTWGSERKVPFLEHIFARVRASLDVWAIYKKSAENIDSIILDNAVAFIEALSLSSVGDTNFTSNQYVRSNVLEALMCTFLTSHRKVATRLKINRLSVPQLIIKWKEFDKIKCKAHNKKSTHVE